MRTEIQSTSDVVSLKHAYYAKLREIYNLFEFENLVKQESKRIFIGSPNKTITSYLHDKVKSTEAANELLELYKVDVHRDLIEDLKSLSSNYSVTAAYLAPFVEHNILNKDFKLQEDKLQD